MPKPSKGIVTLYGEHNFIENKWSGNLFPLKDYWNYLMDSSAPWRMNDSSHMPRLFSFAGGLWLLVFVCYRRVETVFLAALSATVIVFMYPVFVYANINETRVLYPILPYLVFAFGYILSQPPNNSGAEQTSSPFKHLLYANLTAILALLALYGFNHISSLMNKG